MFQKANKKNRKMFIVADLVSLIDKFNDLLTLNCAMIATIFCQRFHQYLCYKAKLYIT